MAHRDLSLTGTRQAAAVKGLFKWVVHLCLQMRGPPWQLWDEWFHPHTQRRKHSDSTSRLQIAVCRDSPKDFCKDEPVPFIHTQRS